MKKLYILHLGIGNVGKEIVRQISKQKREIEKELHVSLEYVSQFSSKNSKEEINEAIQHVSLPFVLIDSSASDEVVPYIGKSLRRGGFAVLANKKPLSGKQKNFDLLNMLGGQRFFYECVVGAGLPVIRPLKDLLLSGDKVMEIQGCLSGTLGFLFSQLDNGKPFSQAVIEAKEKGFTEPDPRDDLSGKDVARKALILARLIGRKIELEDIRLVGLYPKKMQKLSVKDFLKNLNQLDEFYKQKVDKARNRGKVLRYVAKVSAHKCSVGLQNVGRQSDIGSLQGPDNLIIFKSKRYFKNPLIIKGPGAGIEVTAAGVFTDVLSVVKMIKGGDI